MMTMNNCFLSSKLEESASTLACPTVAVFNLAVNTAHVVAVVPGELRAGLDVADGEEGNPREAQVMGVNKHVLHKHVGFTRVLWKNIHNTIRRS